MSGHSKWANIKHRKESVDKKKGKIFSQMAKMITIAARSGGDPGMNPSLRITVEKAKAANMPNDNIERAIKKGTGENKEGQLEEIVYEAFGPNGVPLIINVITDNKNRTSSEIRHILSQYNGRIGESGTVKWMFKQKGLIEIDLDEKTKEELELLVIDSGADDFKWVNDALEVYTKPDELENTKKNLEKSGIKIKDASLDWVPKNEMKIEDESIKKQLEKLFEALDDNDDVNEIYSNVDL